MNDYLNLGVAVDARTDEEKNRDFQHEEFFGAAGVTWAEKPQSAWKRYSLRDQDGSYSCVAQSTAKAKEIKDGDGVAISAHPIYARRSNFPEQGMWLQDAAEIIRKQGTTTEALDPSQLINEDAMNKPVSCETPLKNPVYFTVKNYNDIETLASIIEAQGSVIAVFHANSAEWCQDVPQVIPGSVANIGHCITFVDYTLWQGKKALIADDSWGHATTLGNGGQRVITEDFLKARFVGALYWPKTDPVEPQKPVYHFLLPLEYGLMNDPAVKSLQDMLKYEGFLLSSIPSTGNFLNYTAWAVRKWQLFHGLTDFQNETNPANIRFGYKSIAVANNLYSGVK